MNDLAAIDAPPELKQNVASCMAWSQSNEIATPESFARTGDHLKTIKAAQKQVDEFFDPPIKQAFDLHKLLVGRKKIFADPLKQSESLDKGKMIAYSQEQQRKAEAERLRLQAIADEKARKERMEAEQAAARQRQIEAEARAKAEKARLEAEQASAAEKRRLLAQAEAAERKAEAAAIKADAQQEAAASVIAPVVAVATQAPKVGGVATVTTWKARVVNADLVPREYLMVNEPALDKIAKAMKGNIKIPGVEFYSEQGLSARSR